MLSFKLVGTTKHPYLQMAFPRPTIVHELENIKQLEHLNDPVTTLSISLYLCTKADKGDLE